MQDTQTFYLRALDLIDVLVSELERFRPQDHRDLTFLVANDFVSHKNLLARFRMVLDYYAMDARAEELARFVKN